MTRCNKLIMRGGALFLLLPLLLLAISVPVSNNTTGLQHNISMTTMAQTLTAGGVTNLLKAPYMTKDDYSVKQNDETGTSKITDAAEYETQSFERQTTADFNSGDTTSGYDYIIVTVTSGPTTGQDWYTIPRDLRTGKTQSSKILRTTSHSPYKIEQTTESTLIVEHLNSNTKAHNSVNRDSEKVNLNNTTIWGENSNTPTMAPHSDTDFNGTVTHTYRDYNTTHLLTSPWTNTERDHNRTTHTGSKTDTNTGLHTYTNTNGHTITPYRIMTKELKHSLGKPTQQTTHVDNKTKSYAHKNKTVHHNSQPNCDEQVKLLSPSQYTRLVCFVTLWAIAVTAAVFLGITVFLWVRLSIHRKMERGRERWVEEDGVRGMGRQADILWIQPKGTMEERVEFWYENEPSAGLKNTGGKQWKERRNRGGDGMRGNEKGGAREIENFWVQPKVTLEEITEFWYANRIARQDRESELL
ncbi:hypothetical protein AAFF_G00366500 [Aldrovandia affinis]|uniref:Uncharacterized protein n=1 Tax=Aldrovandia affinis TaxID=143900 RepID=A0AAD7WMQ1_9TELE|nr:hypothetical protein AAFF_G00366500 [Aldrovandia affinis]